MASESYLKFISKFLVEYKDYSNLENDIELVKDNYKFEGFNLDAIAGVLSSYTTERIVQCLALFHMRGTMISKMKKTINKDKITSFQTLTAGIKDNSRTDKTAVTLARISLAVPSVSLIVASKVQMNQIATDFLDGLAFLSCNSIPCILRAEAVKNRDMIWEIYILASINLTLVVSKKQNPDMQDIIEKTVSYAKLSYDGAKEPLELLKQSVKILNDLVIPSEFIENLKKKLDYNFPMFTVPAAKISKQQLGF